MLNRVIGEFISSQIADGRSKCTIKAYTSDLSDFEGYVTLSCDKDLKDINSHDLRLWLNSLSERGLSPQTRARKVSSIRSFFCYLSKMEYISGKNPADTLEAPKLPKKQPKVISESDARSLLSSARYEHCEHVTTFRDYTIVAVFLFTGIRREELTNVTLGDVCMQERTILIHGKGNKERTVYINDSLYPILSEYMNGHRKQIKTAKDSKYLFPSNKNEQIDVGSINRIVNRIMTQVGIKETGISAHILRKRFATTVFSETHDIATTSLLLGHSSPTVTMRYVAIDETTMRNAAATVNF